MNCQMIMPVCWLSTPILGRYWLPHPNSGIAFIITVFPTHVKSLFRSHSFAATFVTIARLLILQYGVNAPTSVVTKCSLSHERVRRRAVKRLSSPWEINPSAATRLLFGNSLLLDTKPRYPTLQKWRKWSYAKPACSLISIQEL